MVRYLSQNQLAKLTGVSKQGISKAVSQGRVVRISLGIDPTHPTNRHFIERLEMVRGTAEPEPTKTRKTNQRKRSGRARGSKTTKTQTIKPKTANGETTMIGGYSKTQIDIQKSVAQIQEIQLKVDERRRKLISRELVDRFFGKLYLVDSNEWKTLPDRLAPEMAAIFENDDPEKILEVSKRIDKEVYRTLSHVKRMMDDFLKTMQIEGSNALH